MGRVAVTVLQLDTNFPRVPGDIGCPDTYLDEIQIIRIPQASIRNIVTDKPQDIDIQPFLDAIPKANGEIIVTSCGFLSFWQNTLSEECDRPFVSSSLVNLPNLRKVYSESALLTLTFDSQSLTQSHLGNTRSQILGLPRDGHLFEVIKQDKKQLDTSRAGAEIRDHLRANFSKEWRHVLLECTNLPPYKAEIRTLLGLPITDILTSIEALRPGSVRTDFL